MSNEENAARIATLAPVRDGTSSSSGLMTAAPMLADLDAARLRTLAQRSLHPAPVRASLDPRAGRPPGPSDFDLNPELLAELAFTEPMREAAVLVPVVAGAPMTLLLTRRTEHLARHAGQVAFPGGRLEPGETALAAALREAEEEIGLAPDLVEPLGYLDGYRTGTGFHVTPVVALVTPGFTLALDPHEVAEAFEVPLAFLLDAANHRQDQREWRGRMRSYYAMPYGEHYIWGATAGMIRNLSERLRAA
ncbi:MAG: CoA pyrophosphatase [Hyphomicrobiaceae bacterium]